MEMDVARRGRGSGASVIDSLVSIDVVRIRGESVAAVLIEAVSAIDVRALGRNEDRCGRLGGDLGTATLVLRVAADALGDTVDLTILGLGDAILARPEDVLVRGVPALGVTPPLTERVEVPDENDGVRVVFFGGTDDGAERSEDMELLRIELFDGRRVLKPASFDTFLTGTRRADVVEADVGVAGEPAVGDWD